MSTMGEGSDRGNAPVFPFRPIDSLQHKDNPIKFPAITGEEGEGSELSVDGMAEFEWDLRGLDCPDCAMKATTVIRRVPGVKEAIVSATEGG